MFGYYSMQGGFCMGRELKPKKQVTITTRDRRAMSTTANPVRQTYRGKAEPERPEQQLTADSCTPAVNNTDHIHQHKQQQQQTDTPQ
jgi:hypothetical protein